MTHRVLARDIVRAVADEAAKVLRGERADWAPIDAKVAFALDAAELRGAIRELERMLAAHLDVCETEMFRKRIAEIKAEEKKR